MFDEMTNGVLLIGILPLAATVGLALNLFIRARGGRALSIRLKGLGIDLKIDTSPVGRVGEQNDGN